MPRLSIVTVCYNSEKTIRETLESVMKQECMDYEYIIVDGKSKDGTIAIVEEYQPKFDGRLRYISEPDHGIYDAMNKGIGMCSGEYIGLINSDDYYLDHAFANVLKTVDSATVTPDLIFSDMDRVDDEGKVVRFVPGDTKKLWKGMFVNHPTCFIRREAYLKYGTYDTNYKIVADYDLVLRMNHGGAVFCKCPDKISCLRTGGASFMNFASEKEKFRMQRKYYNIFVCCYVYLRSIYSVKIRPLLKKT